MSSKGLQASIERLRQGPCNEAWSDFYRETRPKIANVLFRKGLRDAEQVKDLVQLTFLKFLTRSPWHYSQWQDLPDAPQLLAYLKMVAQHVLADHFRRLKRRPETSLEDLGSRATPSEGSVDGGETRILFDELLVQLGEEEQELLSWLVAGEKLPEIAERLGISYSAAGARVHRLRKKILGMV